MFFSKKKKEEEILPPPPPFPGMELDDSNIVQVSQIEIPEPHQPIERPSFDNEMIGVEELVEKDEEMMKSADEDTQNEEPPKSESKKSKKDLAKETKLAKKKEILEAKKEAKIAKEKQNQVRNLETLEKADNKIEIEVPTPAEMEVVEEKPAADTIIQYQQLNDQNNKHLEEAREEINSAILKIKNKEKPSFFKNLFAKLPQKSNIERISERIAASRVCIAADDFDGAKSIYLEVMRMYNSFDKTEKAMVYNDIKSLYEDRKKSEKPILV